MTENTKDFQESSDVPVPVPTLRGATYELAKLRPQDVAKAAEDMIAARRKSFINDLRGIPLPDPVLAEALAKISCTPIALTEILQSWEGRMRLLHLSVVRGGHAIGYNQFVADLDPIDHNDLINELYRVSALRRQAEGDENPTPMTSTSGPSEARNGESSSPGSATTTD